MKAVMKKLGFRKMDEMERYIAFKAQRNAYLFLLIALLAWTFYESYQVFANGTMLNIVPSALLLTATSIQNISQLVIAQNAVKDEETYRIAPWLKVVLWIFAITSVVATVGAVLILAGI